MIDSGRADFDRRTFLRHQIVDCVCPQHHAEFRAGPLQCAGEPEDRIVLFFQRGPVSCFDNIQNLHTRLLVHLVGMISVLVDSPTIVKKSAGLPRRTPSTAFVAPRSSTQRPQLTQVRRGLSAPSTSTELTNALVVGCSSSSTLVPFTGLACGV